MTFTILYDDYRVALYRGEDLVRYAKHDYLNVETLANVIPELVPGATVNVEWFDLAEAGGAAPLLAKTRERLLP